MISDKRVNNVAKPETKASDLDEKEQKNDEFDAVLDECFLAYIPVNNLPQSTPKIEKTDGFTNENRLEIADNQSENRLLTSTSIQSPPVEFNDFSQFEKKSKIDFSATLNLRDVENAEKPSEIIPDKNPDFLNTDIESFKNSDENNVKDFEIITDEPIEKPKNIFTSQNLFESALNIEKSESTHKLPKLFSEVSGLLEMHQQNFSLEISVNETPPTVDANKAFIEQIEPRLLELAAITQRTNEKQILKMKLHPAELGMVEIKIEKGKNGKLTAHFHTESDAAKQILTENIDQLRDSLQNSGWEVENMEVTSDSSTTTSFENSESQSRQSETAENNGVKASKFDGEPDNTTDLKENILNRLLSVRA